MKVYQSAVQSNQNNDNNYLKYKVNLTHACEYKSVLRRDLNICREVEERTEK